MITNFTAENYRSIDEEIKLSFEADSGIKDMDNRGYTTVANTRVLNAKAFYGFGELPELPYIKNMSE